MMKRIVAALILISGLIYFGTTHWQSGSVRSAHTGQNDDAISNAFHDKQSGIQVAGAGTVIRILPDDTEGRRHQRFILKLASGQTILIAHNIDLAPKIKSLKTGDVILFCGIYEWSSKGGTVHWTHHDPEGNHINGWLKKGSQIYQ
nr:DUF3465 domain-containing protein [Tichowtungia aerotolerans]